MSRLKYNKRFQHPSLSWSMFQRFRSFAWLCYTFSRCTSGFPPVCETNHINTSKEFVIELLTLFQRFWLERLGKDNEYLMPEHKLHCVAQSVMGIFSIDAVEGPDPRRQVMFGRIWFGTASFRWVNYRWIWHLSIRSEHFLYSPYVSFICIALQAFTGISMFRIVDHRKSTSYMPWTLIYLL